MSDVDDASSPNEDLRSIRNASADASRGSRDVVKPIKRISSQKILEKLELIEKNLKNYLINLNKLKSQWIKIVMLTRIREAYMLIN